MNGRVAKKLRKMAYGKEGSIRGPREYFQTNKINKMTDLSKAPDHYLKSLIEKGARIVAEQGKKFLSVLTYTQVASGHRSVYQQLKKRYYEGTLDPKDTRAAA